MIEKILYACVTVAAAIVVILVVVAFVYAIHEVYIATKKEIEKNRLKKFIKDNEQKAVPCHCGGHAYIEHRFGEFYHIGCTSCPTGFTDKDIPKLVKMWNDVQSIKAGDYVDAGVFKGRVQSVSCGEAYVYADTYNTYVEVPLPYLKKVKPSSAKVV